MKYLIQLSLCFLLFCGITEAQTNATIAGPENVLVVYNANSDTSIMVANYYSNVRGIPTSNIVPLDSLVSKNITIGGDTHPIIIAQGTDIIRDSLYHEWGAWFPTEHAWKYFYQYVAAPIKEHLLTNNLTNTIRYIVLCKGVPSKIQAGGDSATVISNVTVDGLLCLLNTNNYEDFLHDLYTVIRSYALPGTNYCYSCTRQITNPYCNLSNIYGIDPNYTFNYRFKPDHFTTTWNNQTVKLSYLVSHLDGLNYGIVQSMINKSSAPDMSGTASWVIDGDPTWGTYNYYFADTKNKLESLGFDVAYNNSNEWITSSDNNIMGYTSWGTHAEDGNCSWDDSAWVKDSLTFNLANGAVFNSIESFNGNSISILKWRYVQNLSPECHHTQGLATQFTEIGGTGLMAHAWEPFLDGVVESRKFFPSYAMGYGLVDAIYQGMKYLAWQNIVVGDPLTTIAWGKQTLTENIEMEGTNLITGELEIPVGNTISIGDSAVLNFRHDGFITGDGLIITDTTFTLNTFSWQKSVFKSVDNNHPKIIWAAYPDTVTITGYKIFRKWRNDYYEELVEVNQNTFSYTDVDVDVIIPGSELPKNAFYYVQALFQTEPYTSISNTVDYWVERAQKNVSGIEKFSYQLLQNYPNPFNPLTTINFEIPVSSKVMLKIYGILGNEITTLINDVRAEGIYSVQFDASDFPSGVYIYKLQAGTFVSTRKMMLVK